MPVPLFVVSFPFRCHFRSRDPAYTRLHMLGFVLRRLLISIPILFLSSILVFVMVANAGDPLGDLKGRNPPVPKAVIKAREHQYGLDKPATTQYVHWVT